MVPRAISRPRYSGRARAEANISIVSDIHSGPPRPTGASPGALIPSLIVCVRKKYDAVARRGRGETQEIRSPWEARGGAGREEPRASETRDTVGERSNRNCILNSPTQARPSDINAVSIVRYRGALQKRLSRNFVFNSSTHELPPL